MTELLGLLFLFGSFRISFSDRIRCLSFAEKGFVSFSLISRGPQPFLCPRDSHVRHPHIRDISHYITVLVIISFLSAKFPVGGAAPGRNSSNLRF